MLSYNVTYVDIRVHRCGESWINNFQTGTFRDHFVEILSK